MKLCFVTVGATASFKKLLQAILRQSFLSTLANYQFTHLAVQFGKDGQELWDDFIAKNPPGSEGLHGIMITGFDFKPSLGIYYELAMWNPIREQEFGLVISHAGTGSILEALRSGLPLLVVPNPDLADNHQEELALQMQRGGYAIMATVDELESAIGVAEVRRGLDPPIFRKPEGDSFNLTDGAMLDQLSYVD